MGNDADSYYCCQYLKKKFDVDIGGYCSFISGLYINKERTKNKSPIYVDLSIAYGTTFDNHVSFIQNPLAINPNQESIPYHKKYNGSALSLLLSLYNADIAKYSEKQLTTLLCIDGWYRGYYNKNGAFRDININWFNTLGFKDCFLPLLEQNEMSYFIDFAKEHYLTEKIFIDKHGYLYSANKNMKLPKYRFELVQPITQITAAKEDAIRQYEQNPNAIFVAAETYKNKYVLNLKSDLIN